MLCFCESASIQTSRLYDRTFHPSLCLQAGLNLTRPRLKGVSFRPCFEVSWVLSFFQLREPTWLTRPSNIISISYRISSLFLLTAGRKINMALTWSSPKSLHALTVSLAWAVLTTLSSLLLVCPLPQHISSLCTETSNLSRLRLKCHSFPLLFILPSTTLKRHSTVAFEMAFLIPAFPLYPQSSEFL